MSELIGAIIGDGNLYEKGSWVEITGNAREDLDYFNKLAKIIKKELNYSAHIFFRPDSIKLRVYKKEFIEYLKTLDIPTGRGKSLHVLIPSRICKKWELANACIRGIYDTDGSVTFDKRKIYVLPYPRVVLHINNVKLMEQISGLLSSRCGFRPLISYKESSLYLNGLNQVKLFLNEIGFSNDKHLIRINRFYPTLLTYNSTDASVTQSG
ncbi:MAG TPA: LAGLIDADG family homing endonuclease [Candidatus Aquilonibacter sp.]|nr:LAGLIDADG family homing endonuclease [Candidatus Aquilonibacter sp.]